MPRSGGNDDRPVPLIPFVLVFSGVAAGRDPDLSARGRHPRSKKKVFF